MSHRQDILGVYRGESTHTVPFMLDLSHWFYHRNRRPWDLSRSYLEPEHDLIAYHRRADVGFYLPNLASFYDTVWPPDVSASVKRSDDGARITWTFDTPVGSIRRTRVWEDESYSWAIAEWGARTEADLRVLACAMKERRFTPAWDRYEKWGRAVGDLGVVYITPGYSGVGLLLSLWMGIESVMYLAADQPELLREVVDAINESNLRLVDLLAQSPAEVILLGDNFSSDVQSPRFFREWSREYYREAVRRLHAAGKFVAVHVDGRMKGLLREFAEIGMDCIDAVTPKPSGDLFPAECRREAGPNLILSGGVAPHLWTHDVSDAEFERAVCDWLELRHDSPRLIANAGDQVPPDACEHRIGMMRELVEEHGRVGCG